jgi:hypothetical protein
MNGAGEHTLTIFRNNPGRNGSAPDRDEPAFTKIAELRIDGSISIRETTRSQAYQLGMANGASFLIAAYGRDYDSPNIMDQVEFIYSYNGVNGLYEQSRINKIPGNQIEQRTVRELLGNPGAFETFIAGLWYYTSPQGTIDSRQYIYFDPSNREIIFYGDETQQVFGWQNSSATRYGLYLSSQNISVTTLRRFIDIELESLDSIRVKVVEDVRLRFGVNAPWDGSYRKAGPLQNRNAGRDGTRAHIDASYDSSMGKIRFLPNGNYEIHVGGMVRQGKYTFFNLENQEILELRSMETLAQEAGNENSPAGRETYLVEMPGGVSPAAEQSDENQEPRKSFSLTKIRLGARGIERLHEGTVTLNLAEIQSASETITSP